MAAFSYVAKREIISGHTLDVVYDYDYSLLTLDRSVKKKVETSTALDGSQETIIYNRVVIYSASFRFNAADILQAREFMASIDGGEAFIFDELGTVAVPVNGINCRIEGVSRERRVQKLTKFDVFLNFRVI